VNDKMVMTEAQAKVNGLWLQAMKKCVELVKAAAEAGNEPALWASGKLRQHTTEEWIRFLTDQGLYDETEDK